MECRSTRVSTYLLNIGRDDRLFHTIIYYDGKPISRRQRDNVADCCWRTRKFDMVKWSRILDVSIDAREQYSDVRELQSRRLAVDTPTVLSFRHERSNEMGVLCYYYSRNRGFNAINEVYCYTVDITCIIDGNIKKKNPPWVYWHNYIVFELVN